MKCCLKNGLTRTRACTNSAKEERRSEILAAAGKLFAKHDYEDVSIDDVARGAGVAKGTVYLYFKTKETLFLELYEEAFGSWICELVEGFAEHSSTPAALASHIAATLCEHMELVRMLALIHSVFEENVDEATLRSFKLHMLGLIRPPAALLESALHLQEGKGIRLMMWMHALLVGFSQIIPRRALHHQLMAEEPELQVLHIDFKTDFEGAIASLLAGIGTTASILFPQPVKP